MKPLALFGGRTGAAVAIEDRQPAGRAALEAMRVSGDERA
jgi:hypothetical protein